MANAQRDKAQGAPAQAGSRGGGFSVTHAATVVANARCASSKARVAARRHFRRNITTPSVITVSGMTKLIITAEKVPSASCCCAARIR
jgi:hypothetical protein